MAAEERVVVNGIEPDKIEVICLELGSMTLVPFEGLMLSRTSTSLNAK